MITLAQFADWCGGNLHAPPELSITGFATDSRDVREGNLFLAIRGERVNGHEFARDALRSGAVAVLAESPIDGPHILVEDLENALASFGRTVRAGFDGPVVGITGSNGKTTTKELCAAALGHLGPVLRSAGNKNTQYTSPLVWAELTADHAAAVIEMGMRGPGQIAHLAQIAQPTIGIVTVVGTAHIEKVGTREGILSAKAELLSALPSDGTAIIWREDDYFENLRQAAAAPVKTFGCDETADCRVMGYRSAGWGRCTVRLKMAVEEAEIELNTFGKHQALNAAAAVLAAVCAGVPFVHAVARLADSELPTMRLEVLNRGGITVLLDTYNASPDSTIAAIGALAQGPAENRRIAILGEMKELGDYTEAGHRAVGRALAESNIDLVLLTGGATRFIFEEAVRAGMAESHLVSLSEPSLRAARAFLDGARTGDAVLIKGSRALGLEKILEGWRE